MFPNDAVLCVMAATGLSPDEAIRRLDAASKYVEGGKDLFQLLDEKLKLAPEPTEVQHHPV